jgi:hypothetical protein
MEAPLFDPAAPDGASAQRHVRIEANLDAEMSKCRMILTTWARPTCAMPPGCAPCGC